jgi:hypothetical protein
MTLLLIPEIVVINNSTGVALETLPAFLNLKQHSIALFIITPSYSEIVLLLYIIGIVIILRHTLLLFLLFENYTYYY